MNEGAVVGSERRHMRRPFAAVGIFVALPFLHFIADNPDYEVPIGRLFAYYLVAVVLLTSLVALVGARTQADVGRFAVVAGLCFYSLGYLSVALRGAFGVEPALGVDGSVWIFAALVLSALLLSRWMWVQSYTLVVGVLLVAALAIQAVLGRHVENAVLPEALAEPLELSPSVTPNIYWFVLDGYGRADVLENEYGYTDQGQFITELSSHELAVSDGAMAGYPLTYLSMASTLVVDYLAAGDATLYDPDPYVDVIKGQNRVVATLRGWGYEYVHVDNGWTGSG